LVAQSLKDDRPRIRFGLMAVKGLGENIVKAIIKERKEQGPYQSLEDLLLRVKNKDLNKRSLEAMAKSGCLDSLAERNKVLYNMDRILSFIQEINRQAGNGQDSLFGSLGSAGKPTLKLMEVEALDKKQRLNWEKELLGLYVSEHPMSELAPKLSDKVVDCSILKKCPAGTEVRVAGVITSLKKIFTKKGDSMLFAKIEDNKGGVEILVFPKVLERDPHLWRVDNIIVCAGKISEKDDESKIICDLAMSINYNNADEVIGIVEKAIKESRSAGNGFRNGNNFKTNGYNNYYKNSAASQVEQQRKSVTISLSAPLDYDISRQLKALIYRHPGNYGLELIISKENSQQQKIKTSFRLDYNNQLIKELDGLLGGGKVVVDNWIML